MRFRIPVAVVCLLVAACGSSDGGSRPTTSPSAVSTSTTAASATTTSVSPGTTVAPATSTTAPATTAAATTTTATCPVVGTAEATVVDFPHGMSALVGTDIRTGAHPCYERIVLEFASFDPAVPATRDALPGYRIRYEDRPILDSPRGEPVEVLGEAVLVVSAASWMGDMEGRGYAGPRDVRPTNVTHVLQLLQLENFEGMTAWAIGLDARYRYVVTELDAPPRIVIDLQLT